MTAENTSTDNLTASLGSAYKPSTDITDIYINSKDSSIDPAASGQLIPGQYISSFDQPEHGEVELREDGTFSYTPSADYSGPDTFVFYASNDTGEILPTTIYLSVLPYSSDAPTEINHLPDAKWDSAQTSFNTKVNIDVVGNDKDPDLDDLAITEFTQASNGIVVKMPDGTFDYQPNDDFVGSDEFTYTITDGKGGYDTAKVNITVNPADHGPSASDDAVKTAAGQAVLIDVLKNDNDPENDPLKIDAFLQPDSGTVEETETPGVLLFTPNEGFTGDVFFPYWITDSDGNRAEAVVYVLVHDAVDVPELPKATDDNATTKESESVNISALDNDLSGDSQTLALYSFGQPGNGSVKLASNGEFIYTPNDGFSGDDQFGYIIVDENGHQSSAQVCVTVTPVNDAPQPQTPQLVTNEDTALTIDLSTIVIDPEGGNLILEGITAQEGTIALDVDGSLLYTPNPNFNGEDTLLYTVTDEHGASTTSEFTIIVNPINDLPAAEDDIANTLEDSSIVIDVLQNDEDIDGDKLTVTDFDQPTNGTVTYDENGALIYTPAANFNGQDSFSYTADDGQGGQSTATVTVVVTGENDSPLAQDDSTLTQEDSAVEIKVLENDGDTDGDTLTIEQFAQPENGVVSLSKSGTFVYTPDQDFHGKDSFTYEISDGKGGTSQALVVVTVTSINDAPVAADDTVTTDEDTAVTITVLTNDNDPDGDDLTVDQFEQPDNGKVTLNADGTFSYQPNAGFSGEDAFTYSITDSNGETSSATVSILVNSVNDAAVAADDAVTTDEDTAVTITVLANDNDPDGDDLTVDQFEQPDNGKVTLNADGTFSYQPNAGFSGEDAFTYTITDGNGGSSTATVDISVNPVNTPPEALDYSTTTDEGVPVTIQVPEHVSDSDGDMVSIESIVTAPEYGSIVLNEDGTITYTPEDGFSGYDGFGYQVTDGQGGTDTAWVNVEVKLVNEAPVIDDSATTTNQNTPLTLALLDKASDANGDEISLESIVTQPSNGALTLGENGEVTYTPNSGYSGFDGFGYQISDGQGGTDTAWVNIEVKPTNEAPIAVRDSVETDENSSILISVLDNDSDPDGNELTVIDYTEADYGTLLLNTDGTFNYEPDEGFSGYDCFSYVVSDGQGGIDVAKVQVHIVAVNQAPVATDDSATTQEDQPLVISVLDNDSDADNDSLTIESFAQPDNGLVTLNQDGTFNYTPKDDFVGQDNFTYTITDGNGEVSSAQVIVTVTGVNDAPVAADDTVTTDEDTAVTITVLANDSDPDGDDLTVDQFEQPDNGKVTLNADGTFGYVPNPNFEGQDSFSYSVRDGQGGTSTAWVVVTVNGVNDAPVAAQDMAQTTEDNPVRISVLDNDSDADGDLLSISGFEQPANGTISLLDDGSFSYQPNSEFHGEDAFTYSITDSNGGTSTATVKLTVLSVNDAPIASDDNADTKEGETVVIRVLDNDSDVEQGPLSIESVGQAENGIVTINADGTLSYTPNDGYHGTDTFTYTISDGDGGTSTAQVMVSVEQDSSPVCAKLVGNSDIKEGSSQSYHVELDQALDHDSWYLLQTNDGSAQRVDHYADQQDIMWGGFFDARKGIGGEVIGVYEGKIPNGAYLHKGMRDATGPDDASWDFSLVKDCEVIEGGVAWVKVEAGQTRSESIDIEAWSEKVTVDQDAGTAAGHQEGTEQFTLEITDSRDAEAVEICDAEMTVKIHDQSDYNYVSPIALDLNRDGQIGVTGNSTAKERNSNAEIGRTVQFDIDADGDKDSIEWLNGDGDGMLVDNRDGNAATDMDGSRLFGDESGQYAHGYEKLSQLDENADGEISGDELNGLSIWVDDGDAVVEEGEMASLFEHGITAISTQMQSEQNAAGESLMRSTAKTASGESIMTEDVWFAQSDVALDDMLAQDESVDQLLNELSAEQPQPETHNAPKCHDSGSSDSLQKLAELYDEQSQDVTSG